MIKKIIHFIKNQKHYLSSDRYIAFLRSKEITIGENCIIKYIYRPYSPTSYLNRKQGRYEHQFQNIYS